MALSFACMDPSLETFATVQMPTRLCEDSRRRWAVPANDAVTVSNMVLCCRLEYVDDRDGLTNPLQLNIIL
jgi:hypothetical protein